MPSQPVPLSLPQRAPSPSVAKDFGAAIIEPSHVAGADPWMAPQVVQDCSTLLWLHA